VNTEKPETIEQTETSTRAWKRVLTVVVITPFIPLIILLGLLTSGGMCSDDATVDDRFALSASTKSPYLDTAKGTYEYAFAFCSDPHLEADTDSYFPELDEAIRTNRAAFVVFGGDLTFLGKESEYRTFVEHANALTVPVYPALGNHDLYNDGWSTYWRYLGPSAYTFIGGNAKFVVIDTASGRVGEADQEGTADQQTPAAHRGQPYPRLLLVPESVRYPSLRGPRRAYRAVRNL